MIIEGVRENILNAFKKAPVARPLLMSILAGTMLLEASPASANSNSFTATINCSGNIGEGAGYIFLPDRQEELSCSPTGDRSQSKTFTAQLPFGAEVGYIMELADFGMIGWEDYIITESPNGGLNICATNRAPCEVNEMSTYIWTIDGNYISVNLDLRRN